MSGTCAQFQLFASRVRGFFRIPIASLLLMICASAQANTLPPQRFALVIGNSTYKSSPLENPAKDAMLMSDTLRQLGFKVILKQDLNRQSLFTEVRDFANQLPEGSNAFVYFAGHGIQINGANYLLPVDIIPTSEKGIAVRAYPLKILIDQLSASRASTNIVVLDACRNNPFQTNGKSRYRSLQQLGLAKVATPKGSLIAYYTAPGQLAEDGSGRNHSLYTETLVAEIIKPGQRIEDVFKNIADTVRKKSYDDQQPWFETSLVGEYYFTPPSGIHMAVSSKLQKPIDRNDSGATRALPALAEKPATPWYMQLTAGEWTQFDWEVEQRVKNMTADELPKLIHRAESGNVVAQTTLGIVYREGIHKTVEAKSQRIFRSGANNTKALKWLHKAADANFPMAQVELGEMYYEANGVERSPEISQQWLSKAARANYPRAQVDLEHVLAIRNNFAPSNQLQLMQVIRRNSEKILQEVLSYDKNNSQPNPRIQKELSR